MCWLIMGIVQVFATFLSVSSHLNGLIAAVSVVNPAVDVHHISTHTGIVPYKNFTMRIAQYLSDIQLMGLPIRLEVT